MQRTQASHRTETRLEEHRRLFTQNGGRGSLLKIEELNQAEMQLVNYEFMERCRGRCENIDAMYAAYIETLHSWGVMCPHPQHMRLYDGFHRTDVPLKHDEAQWYNCTLCGSSVINL